MDRARRATWAALGLGVAATLVSATVGAQTKAGYAESREGRDQSVVFDDDPMRAAGMDAVGVTLKVRGGPARFLLVKPRLDFLQELRKSVESL